MLLSFVLLALVAGNDQLVPPPDETVVLTQRFFGALRASNADDFAAVTGLPFTFGTANHPKARRCDGTSKDESQLKQLFDCVLKDEDLLVHELGEFSNLDFIG